MYEVGYEFLGASITSNTITFYHCIINSRTITEKFNAVNEVSYEVAFKDNHSGEYTVKSYHAQKQIEAYHDQAKLALNLIRPHMCSSSS